MTQPLSTTQVHTMLQMQSKLNAAIHPSWAAQRFDWTQAIINESAELADHFGWKWWKKQEPNIPQCKMELVDIWHFILSVAAQVGLENNTDLTDTIVEDLAESVAIWAEDGDELDHSQFLRLNQLIVLGAIEQDVKELVVTWRLACAAIGFEMQEVYQLYIVKNVLNDFRRQNGYKEGTYIKAWHDVGYNEDNDFALEILPTLGTEYVADTLYSILEQKYSEVVSLNKLH